MVEVLTPQRRTRSIIIVSLLLTLQGVSWLVLAVFTAVLGVLTVRNAVADHKPTAAALTTAFAAFGGGLFFLISLLTLLFTWGIWKQKSWSYLASVILELLLVLICLASLFGAVFWPFLAESALALVILICLCVNRQVRAVS